MTDFNFAFEQFPSLSDIFNSEAGIGACILALWIIVCMWKVFKKAGLPGWGSIIPFYNIYLRFKASGMSGWWVLSFLLPPVGVIALFVSFFKIPERFGKHRAFGLGLLITFLNPIFMGILAFDKSKCSN